MKGRVQDRAFAFLLVLVTGFLLLASLVASTVLSLLVNFIIELLPASNRVWYTGDLLLSLGIFTLLFSLLFKFVPNTEVAWRDILPGAVITALLFVAGKTLISYYLGQQGVGSTYGAAGSVVVFLVWVYYSAQIFFFGAELTYVYSLRYGTRKGLVQADRSTEQGEKAAPSPEQQRGKSRLSET